MITERLERLKSVAEFSANRIGDYLELISVELSLYRASLVTTLLSCVALVFCGLGTLAFVSVAVVVSFWDTESRMLVAWLVAAAWLLITLIALYIATRNAPTASPFAELSRQARLDISAIRGHYAEDSSSN